MKARKIVKICNVLSIYLHYSFFIKYMQTSNIINSACDFSQAEFYFQHVYLILYHGF